jgi:transcriptional regulator with XRE-family HTH domain
MKKIREGLGMTARDVAARMNVAASYLSEIETGKRNATAALVQRYAAGLNLTPGELLSKIQVETAKEDSLCMLREPETPYRFTPDPAAAQALARSARGIGLGLNEDLEITLADIRVRLQQLHLANPDSQARYLKECHQRIDQYAAHVREKFTEEA